MTLTRRAFLFHAGAVFGLGEAVFSDSSRRGHAAEFRDDDPRFTPPPGDESPDIAALIDKAKTALESQRATPSDVLASPEYLPAHAWPRFRTLIRRFSRDNRTVLVTPREPGDPMHVSGTVLGSDAKPLAGAVIYVYQTSSKGWYSDKAPHVSGNSGDEKHARLFGYMTTDASGRYEFRTIRPAGYPRSDLPQHIHVEIFHPADSRTLITEIRFDDDARLTSAHREASIRDGYVICNPNRDRDGVQRVEAGFRFK